MSKARMRRRHASFDSWRAHPHGRKTRGKPPPYVSAMFGRKVGTFDALRLRKDAARLGLGEVVLRDHPAIAQMLVAPEVGVHAATVAGGWLVG